MQRKKLRSIRTKLLFLLGLSAAIAVAISSIAIFAHTYIEYKEQAKNSLFNTANILSKNLSAPIEFDDTQSADILLQTLQTSTDIEGAVVFTKKKQLFAKYIKKENNSPLLLQNIKQFYNKYTNEDNFTSINKKYVFANVAIFSGEDYLGNIALIGNTDALYHTIYKQLIVSALSFLFSLIIVIVLALKLQKSFTYPIMILEQKMNDIMENKHFSALINNNNDEFYTLFNGFNAMMQQITQQTQDLKTTRQSIEQIHKRTKESIEYASLIQGALLPDNNMIRSYFKDFFVIWHPKDTVGGDIYFFDELRHEDECMLMVIDCTGHGVPGALVTMLVKAIERQIVSYIMHHDEEVSPAAILSIFNSNMKHLLKQENADSISNAGFDGAILYYNKKEHIIRFAGAETPLYYIENNRVKTIKGDRYSVGYKKCNINYKYKEHTIETKDGMEFYISTDGYFDQNGGNKGFPFGKKRFKGIIKEYHKESMADQQEMFLGMMMEYQGEEDTNDDKTVIGLKI